MIVCRSCGFPESEHHYNGACYGICGVFVAMSLKDLAFTKISLTELEALKAEIERLLDAKGRMRVNLANAQTDNARLMAAIRRIDGINDNPAHYNPAINAVCDSILRRDQPDVAGKPEPEHQHEESDLKGDS